MSYFKTGTGRRVLVTGSAGFAAPGIIKELLEAGYWVTTSDRELDPNSPSRHIVADLCNFGEVTELVEGFDTIVHLAATRMAGVRPASATFENNMISTYNIFRAASMMGVRRVIWASSCGIMGSPMGDISETGWASGVLREEARALPTNLPYVEEDDPRPMTTYHTSKVMCEWLAKQTQLWGTDTTFVSLRYGNMCYPEMYEEFRYSWAHPEARFYHLWNYVDMRDAAQACRLAIEADIKGAQEYFITAEDTFMNVPSRDLVKQYFPGATVNNELEEYGTLLSIDKARRELGYAPKYSWRNVMELD